MADFLEYDPLYKRDRNGKVRVWRLQRSDDRYRTVSGILGGAMTETGWTVCEPKNVGKKNSTTGITQAMAEVDAEYQKKLERGYFYNVDDIDNPVPHKPMLAHKYDDLKAPLPFESGGVFTQPKLDGIRCIAKRDGLWTRTGKPILGAPHVFEELQPVFDADPTLIIDGELYNHALKDDFNEIASNVRKTKPKPEDLARSRDLVQYHVYDADIEDAVFYSRYDYMTSAIPDSGIIVPVSTHLVSSQQELDSYYEAWALSGYEGQIIRLNEPYANTRSWNLLKRKEFDTEEFQIVRVEEGNGNWLGYAKRIIVWDPLFEREQPCGLKATKEYARWLLQNADKIAGSDSTVRFFRRTPDGYLRMPVVQDIHNGKRDD